MATSVLDVLNATRSRLRTKQDPEWSKRHHEGNAVEGEITNAASFLNLGNGIPGSAVQLFEM
jgi:hypothetical protein